MSLRRSVEMPTPLTVAASELLTPRPEQPAAAEQDEAQDGEQTAHVTTSRSRS
jgi:hypothetical protein